jgi:hypothetical protein
MMLNPYTPALPIDRWLADLSGSEFKVAMHLLAAASDSPDELISQSHAEIASATGLSWRTVLTALHDLRTRRVLQVVSRDKERTLVKFLGARLYAR